MNIALHILLVILAIGGLFPLLIGIMTIGSWSLPLKPPADASNRINRIRLWWFSISAPHRFANCPGFTWLKGDERDNLKDANWTKSND